MGWTVLQLLDRPQGEWSGLRERLTSETGSYPRRRGKGYGSSLPSKGVTDRGGVLVSVVNGRPSRPRRSRDGGLEILEPPSERGLIGGGFPDVLDSKGGRGSCLSGTGAPCPRRNGGKTIGKRKEGWGTMRRGREEPLSWGGVHFSFFRTSARRTVGNSSIEIRGGSGVDPRHPWTLSEGSRVLQNYLVGEETGLPRRSKGSYRRQKPSEILIPGRTERFRSGKGSHRSGGRY